MDLRIATPDQDAVATTSPATRGAPPAGTGARPPVGGPTVHVGAGLLAAPPGPTDAYLRRRERRRRGRALADAHAASGARTVVVSDRRGYRDPVALGDELGTLAAAATAHRGPVVLHVHGAPAHPRFTGDAATWRTRVVAGPLQGRLLARADLIVAGSAALAEQLSQVGGRRVEVVPPAVLPAPVALPRGPERAERAGDGALRIVSVGPLTARRRPAALIRAVAALDDAHLALVGTGPQRAELDRLATALGISDRVEVVPTASWATVVARLASADVAASAALLPDDPDALLLAAAIGVPVVATRIDSTTAVLTDDVDARLLDPLDDEGLTAALAAIREEPGATARRAASAHRRVTARGWDAVAREIERHLHR